jgi:putative thiazole-containing bacteriocin maturation protein
MGDMLAQSVRPKWKADTYYIPLSHGVYLRGNNSCLILKGKSLYFLLEHLVPNLNGKATLAEITEGLDADRKRMITNLLEKLFTHNFLKDTSQDQLHTLRPVELETYITNITFIESFQTSAASRFERFRNKQLLIIGSGLSFTSLIQTSLQCGVRQISALLTPEDEVGSISFQEMLDLFAGYASEQTVQWIETPSWDNVAEVRNIIQTYDAILHIAERPMLARAQLLNRLCVEQQKTFIQAIIVDDYAWIGPPVCPGTEGCWECAWRRLQANLTDLSEQLSHYEFHDQPLISSSRSLAMPGATMIANRLIFGLFQYFTQIGSTEIAGKLSSIDLITFLSESHAFLPHPHCLACQHPIVPTASQFLEEIQQLQHQSPTDLDIFLENFATCIDNKLGLFTALDNSNFVQAPLAVYKVNLSNPMFKRIQPESLSVVMVSTGIRDACMRTAQKACERYAANLVDRQRLLPPETIQQLSLPAISTDQLVGIKTLPPEDEMWIWALDLLTQQACLVPATHVFSSLCNQDLGSASGKTWEEAICLALLDWCNYLTIGQLKDAQQAYIQVDLVRTPMTPEGVHLYHLLKAVVEQITVYDVTGPLQVPTFATCLGEKVVVYSTHCDGAQALSIGLEQALQQYQSEQFQQYDYAVASVPDLPSILRSDQLAVPLYTSPDTWPARREWLQQKLQSKGLRAFAIPLNHEPALMQVLPFIVRVLLSRVEEERIIQ